MAINVLYPYAENLDKALLFDGRSISRTGLYVNEILATPSLSGKSY